MTHLLVVEDDPAAAEMLTRVLQRAGFEVSVVGNAAEALDLTTRGIHAVVLDLGLPDMDGVQLCRELRAARPSLPIIVVTARSSEADLVITLDAGADDYLVKPFRTRELLARLNALLRRTFSGDVLYIGDVVIDAVAFHASVQGARVPLTPKEFEILVTLARNVGVVVSREELQRTLWKKPLPGHSKSLDMHVSSLRRKLEAAGSSQVITTSRGVGFCLDS